MNVFQEMLLQDVEEHRGVGYNPRIMGLIFPKQKEDKPAIWYRFVFYCIQQGMAPPEGYEEWDFKSCKKFCRENGLDFGKAIHNGAERICFTRNRRR